MEFKLNRLRKPVICKHDAHDIRDAHPILFFLGPARFVKKLTNQNLQWGQKLRLECSFTGIEKMFVTWYKDGKQVYASYRCNTKVLGNTCVLEYLNKCDDDTPGKYSCEVTNEDGSDICHALVTVGTG